MDDAGERGLWDFLRRREGVKDWIRREDDYVGDDEDGGGGGERGKEVRPAGWVLLNVYMHACMALESHPPHLPPSEN